MLIQLVKARAYGQFLGQPSRALVYYKLALAHWPTDALGAPKPIDGHLKAQVVREMKQQEQRQTWESTGGAFPRTPPRTPGGSAGTRNAGSSQWNSGRPGQDEAGSGKRSNGTSRGTGTGSGGFNAGRGGFASGGTGRSSGARPDPRPPFDAGSARRARIRDPKRYYSTLGVPTHASQQDVTKAYRKLALVRHPDKGGSDEAFKQVRFRDGNLSSAVLTLASAQRSLLRLGGPHAERAVRYRRPSRRMIVASHIFSLDRTLQKWSNVTLRAPVRLSSGEDVAAASSAPTGS